MYFSTFIVPFSLINKLRHGKESFEIGNLYFYTSCGNGFGTNIITENVGKIVLFITIG